jgi:iron complex transport system substrate-binding protein
MRIASLVPSATEALFALGLGERVVAVTHECDHPEAATALPRLTRSVVESGLEPAQVDSRVRELVGAGEALYELDQPALAAAQPDLIVTQALCAVCAVSYDDVRAVASRLPGSPAVLSLDPATLDEVLSDLVRLGDACGERATGERLRARLRERIDAVAAAVAGAERPRVAALEWLDPPFAGGHWVPEMIALAGGEDALAAPGSRSREIGWDEIATARPEIAVAMPCGLYAGEAAEQAAAHRDRLAATGASSVFAVDAASSFSRPGPRLADGVELLGHLLHPDLVEAPDGLAWHELGAGAAR